MTRTRRARCALLRRRRACPTAARGPAPGSRRDAVNGRRSVQGAARHRGRAVESAPRLEEVSAPDSRASPRAAEEPRPGSRTSPADEAPGLRFSREALRDELGRAARELRSQAETPGAVAFSAAPYLELLSRAGAQLRGNRLLGLDFQGSYSQTKVAEPVYGGHASAMGPPPTRVAPSDDAALGRPRWRSWSGRFSRRRPTAGDRRRTTSWSPAAAAWPSSTTTRTAGSTCTSSPRRSSRPPASASPTRTRSTGTSGTGSSKTSPRAPAWTRRPGATGSARGTSTTTDGSTSTSRTGARTSSSATAATARSPRWRPRPGSRPGAGARAAPSSTPTPTATSTSTSCATSARATTSCAARSGPSSGAAGRRPWSGPWACPARPTSSSRTAATARSSRPPRPPVSPTRPGPTASGSWPRTTTTTGGWTSSSPTTRIPNFLYRNLGQGRFESVGLLAGVAVNAEGRAQAGMGVDSADYDGDGRLDLVVTNFAHDTDSLYRNLDGEPLRGCHDRLRPRRPDLRADGLGRRLLRRRPRRRRRPLQGQRPHLPERGRVPEARRDVPPEEPAPRERRRAVSRRVRGRGPRAAGAEGGPRPRRGRPRRRRGRGRGGEQHGRRAHRPREPPDAPAITGSPSASSGPSGTGSASARE